MEKIIQNVDPNKAHGHDKISIRMIKICGKSFCKPLQLIFNQCIDTDSFPLEWKKANIDPIHKKGDKTTDQFHCFQFAEKYLRDLIFYKMFRFQHFDFLNPIWFQTRRLLY